MAVMNLHHPWSFTFGILGNIVSFMVYLAPVTTFYRIYRKKSTEGFHSVPYLVALFSAMLWFYYALVKKDAMLLITINSFGCFIEIIYILIFIFYAPTDARKLTVKLLALMNIGTFSLILLVTQLAVRNEYRVPVLGWICVAISVSVFASPLSIVIPNILGFGLGLIQMVLYAIYKNYNKVVEDKNKLPEHAKNIVILSTIATSEVYPVDVHVDAQPDGNEADNNKDHEQNHDHQDQEKSMDQSPV
ncbi:bidirectional sugar transporter SWEET15 isoform X2 [Ziziphus jujuba]|uniref:Bidirectional sugar transporter SWEET n=1 Tax=Ziziphus jujuba TaxID=326968 RepID=A0A6P6G4X2_ZIZJJ|nr:bidirectional sugar transporter SWEET15 isoform X2 [Ziziphus jujuba]